jgi:hypothetical protein
MRQGILLVAILSVTCGHTSPRQQGDGDQSGSDLRIARAAYAAAHAEVLRSVQASRPLVPFYCIGMPGQEEVPADFIAEVARRKPEVRPLAACIRSEWACPDKPDGQLRPTCVFLAQAQQTGDNGVVFTAYAGTQCRHEHRHAGVEVRLTNGAWVATPVLAWFG